jgi:hypothetical protein
MASRMEIVYVNEYLSFVLEQKKRGLKITTILNGEDIGSKEPCPHISCATKYIAEMTLTANQMRSFESALYDNPIDRQN